MQEHTGPTEPLESTADRNRLDVRDNLRVERHEPPHMGAAGTAAKRSSRTDRTDHADRTDRTDRRDPVDAVKDPDNRAKLLLGIAAATLLNLILLVAVLMNVVDDGVQETVVVDGVPCIVAEHDGNESALFCQR
jgi:hypothetical protein